MPEASRVKIGSCTLRSENAPPGFSQGPDDVDVVVAGVEFESTVPTRFFQTVDAYPPEWGRLVWRIQLNALVDGRAAPPIFRTFYSGVEWNLKSGPTLRWFLSAWVRWDGAGPSHHNAGAPAVSLEGNTARFRIASTPEGAIFLRSRIDARDRRRVAAELRAERAEQPTDGSVIQLDDILSG